MQNNSLNIEGVVNKALDYSEIKVVIENSTEISEDLANDAGFKEAANEAWQTAKLKALFRGIYGNAEESFQFSYKKEDEDEAKNYVLPGIIVKQLVFENDQDMHKKYLTHALLQMVLYEREQYDGVLFEYGNCLNDGASGYSMLQTTFNSIRNGKNPSNRDAIKEETYAFYRCALDNGQYTAKTSHYEKYVVQYSRIVFIRYGLTDIDSLPEEVVQLVKSFPKKTIDKEFVKSVLNNLKLQRAIEFLKNLSTKIQNANLLDGSITIDGINALKEILECCDTYTDIKSLSIDNVLRTGKINSEFIKSLLNNLKLQRAIEFLKNLSTKIQNANLLDGSIKIEGINALNGALEYCDENTYIKDLKIDNVLSNGKINSEFIKSLLNNLKLQRAIDFLKNLSLKAKIKKDLLDASIKIEGVDALKEALECCDENTDIKSLSINNVLSNGTINSEFIKSLLNNCGRQRAIDFLNKLSEQVGVETVTLDKSIKIEGIKFVKETLEYCGTYTYIKYLKIDNVLSHGTINLEFVTSVLNNCGRQRAIDFLQNLSLKANIKKDLLDASIKIEGVDALKEALEYCDANTDIKSLSIDNVLSHGTINLEFVTSVLRKITDKQKAIKFLNKLSEQVGNVGITLDGSIKIEGINALKETLECCDANTDIKSLSIDNVLSHGTINLEFVKNVLNHSYNKQQAIAFLETLSQKVGKEVTLDKSLKIEGIKFVKEILEYCDAYTYIKYLKIDNVLSHGTINLEFVKNVLRKITEKQEAIDFLNKLSEQVGNVGITLDASITIEWIRAAEIFLLYTNMWYFNIDDILSTAKIDSKFVKDALRKITDKQEVIEFLNKLSGVKLDASITKERVNALKATLECFDENTNIEYLEIDNILSTGKIDSEFVKNVLRKITDKQKAIDFLNKLSEKVVNGEITLDASITIEWIRAAEILSWYYMGDYNIKDLKIDNVLSTGKINSAFVKSVLRANKVKMVKDFLVGLSLKAQNQQDIFDESITKDDILLMQTLFSSYNKDHNYNKDQSKIKIAEGGNISLCVFTGIMETMRGSEIHAFLTILSKKSNQENLSENNKKFFSGIGELIKQNEYQRQYNTVKDPSGLVKFRDFVWSCIKVLFLWAFTRKTNEELKEVFHKTKTRNINENIDSFRNYVVGQQSQAMLGETITKVLQ